MISKSIHQSLRERYNQEGSLLRRQQMRMLEILLEIDRICKRHGIQYWLSSGTLIGPWKASLRIVYVWSSWISWEMSKILYP